MLGKVYCCIWYFSICKIGWRLQQNRSDGRLKFLETNISKPTLQSMIETKLANPRFGLAANFPLTISINNRWQRTHTQPIKRNSCSSVADFELIQDYRNKNLNVITRQEYKIASLLFRLIPTPHHQRNYTCFQRNYKRIKLYREYFIYTLQPVMKAKVFSILITLRKYNQFYLLII